jgi:hypothetical protein
MPTIYRAAADSLTISEAKRLIVEVLPRETAVNIYATLRSDGTPNFEDGPVEIREEKNVSVFATYIDGDFPKACEQLGIVPRWKYRPTITDYNGDRSQDDRYTISHDEFCKYAGLFGVCVVIGASPAAAEPPARTEGKDERCDRLLRWLEEEQGRGERGALARVVKRDGRARQTVTTDIEYARQKRAPKSATPWDVLVRKER